MQDKRQIDQLKKDKMKYVQRLAAYYQQIDSMELGEKRDQVIKEILSNRQEIFSINKQLEALEQHSDEETNIKK
ncbi:hypothetical protein RV11_GL001172 [Enterococcus phoeniculicola]|jgi:hypothetical protein|uniref:Uncharacterized protein n=1 Tax=Enterococcus phoeniculicola ATCC BAA-412 TaxID=1158610 RepID=R3WF67_9ENTE|nr:hypothetical protein [Enterococcus phoeniculicola]EOL46102.1 hypothetical protein UC3_00908 [Enterococcus phoeniculicola ATCC BAA-412]EOT77053.1 hypothetical protein I589_02014 [Enterococcus phoeniculicola ATCC BAA-412]OJG73392.1 hypothetical protein RV11_GL001172 [Enterococcus phoeniculicola]